MPSKKYSVSIIIIIQAAKWKRISYYKLAGKTILEISSFGIPPTFSEELYSHPSLVNASLLAGTKAIVQPSAAKQESAR